MLMMRAAAGIMALALCAGAMAQSGGMADVGVALANPGRHPQATALDATRKPAELLAFSGIKAGDRVLDVMAGGGYYTELLARLVGPRGQVIALEPPGFLTDPKTKAGWDALTQRDAQVRLLVSLPGDAALPSGLDAALFHLTYHDLYWESAQFKFPRTDPAAFLRKLHVAMKRGGSVIVVDHVGPAGIDPRVEAERTHRIDPAVVRRDFQAAGFRLAGESQVLRVPGDDTSKLVFRPEVRGKTDRIVLRFVRP
jgi:predicted methyltransferase